MNLEEPKPVGQQGEDKHQLPERRVIVAGILISALEVSARVIAHHKFYIPECDYLACQLVSQEKICQNYLPLPH